MQTQLFLLVVLSLPAADGADAMKAEKKALAGSWTVGSAQRDGESLPEDELRKFRLSFADEQLTFKQGEKTNRLQYRLELGNKPPHIDLIAADGPQKDKPVAGIYELKGDSDQVNV